MEILKRIRECVLPLMGTRVEIDTENFVSYSYSVEKQFCDAITKMEGDDLIIKRSDSERSIEDIQIIIGEEIYNIDIKTYDTKKEFSLPSLISIDRCKKTLSVPTNHIIYVLVGYAVIKKPVIVNIMVQKIESFDWSYLSIQNIGKGQLQIKSLKEDNQFNDNTTREEWMKEFIKKGMEYYDGLILKVAQYKQDWEKE